MRPLFSSVRLLMAVLAALVATSPAGARQHADITLRDLARRVAETRSRIHDLSVTFSFNITSGGAGNLFAHSHMSVTLKGTRLLIDHEYSPADKDSSFHRITSFDGERSTIYDASRSTAIVVPNRERELTTNGLGFFDLFMLNPTTSGVSGADRMDLVALLHSPDAVLRPAREKIDGHDCFVVDEFGPDINRPKLTVWIDPARGDLPIRQQYFAASPTPYMQFDIVSAAQIQPGLWVPLTGRKSTGFVPGGPEASNMRWDMIVDTVPGAMISINSGVADSTFDLASNLPPGVKVVRRDNGPSSRALFRVISAISAVTCLVVAGLWIAARRHARRHHPSLTPAA